MLLTLLQPGQEEEEEAEDSATFSSCELNEESGRKKIKVLLLRQEPGKPEVNEATDTCLRYGGEVRYKKKQPIITLVEAILQQYLFHHKF